MTVLTLSTSKVRKGIVHATVFLIAITFIFTEYKLDYIEDILIWQPLAIGLLVLTGFYLHALVLLPVLVRKKRIKQYVLFTIVGFVIFSFTLNWFQACYSSDIRFLHDGTPLNPFAFFFKKRDLIFNALCFLPFLLITFLYYVLVTSKEDRSVLYALKHREFLVHIIVIVTFYSLFFINYRAFDFFRFIVFITILILLFFANAFWLTPILLKTRKHKQYLSYCILMFVLVNMFIRFFIMRTNADKALFSVETIAFNFGFLVIFVMAFSYSYVRLKLKAKEEVFNLKLGAKESELKLLKSQVNPHFLFNTLNTLYGTALEENAPNTAESTAKLANLIRYMQEDIHKDFIPLENEIKYVQDYITIQKLRCSVEPDIDIEFKNIENHQISPGLLIPFVENAFKYGIDPSKKSKLSVSVICNKNTISFQCINSYNKHYKTYYKEQGFGIGIKNAEQRLKLVYPKRHTFEITKANTSFSVKITISI